MRDGSVAGTSSRDGERPGVGDDSLVGHALGIGGLSEAAEVGRGGFAAVYRAHQEQFGRTVAVKLLDPGLDDDSQHRFESECRAMGALSWHPNIVVVHEAGVNEGDRPYLVMEYLDRGTLRDRLGTEGPLPWREVAAIGLELGSAIKAAHDSGVLHRDVKPDNVLIGPSGESKLADFGLAEIRDASLGSVQQFAASIAHVAPEIVRGERASEASDVYSLASTMFELLAGRPAYVDPTDETLATAVTRLLEGDLPDLDRLARDRGVETLPPQLCQIVSAAMADDPDSRPSLAELSRDVEELLGPEGAEHVDRAVPPVKSVEMLTRDGANLTLPPPAAGSPKRRGRLVVAVIGLLLVALLAAVVGIYLFGDSGRNEVGVGVAGVTVEADVGISLGVVEEQSFDIGARTADIARVDDQLLVGTESATFVPVDLGSGTVGAPVEVGEVIDLDSVAASLPDLAGHPEADVVVNAVSYVVPRADDIVVTRLYGIFSLDLVGDRPAELLLSCVPLGAVALEEVVYLPCAPLSPGAPFAMVTIGERGTAPEVIEAEGFRDTYSAAARHGDDIWILDLKARSVVRFDVEARRVDESSRIGQLAVGEGAVMHSAFGYLWIATSEGGDLLRIDVETGSVDGLEVGANPRSLDDGDGLLWVADTEGDEIILVKPGGDFGPESVVTRFNVSEPDKLVYEDGGVWVGSGTEVLRVEVDD